MGRLGRPYFLLGLTKMVLRTRGIEEEANRGVAQPCDFPVEGVHLPAQGAQLLALLEGSLGLLGERPAGIVHGVLGGPCGQSMSESLLWFETVLDAGEDFLLLFGREPGNSG